MPGLFRHSYPTARFCPLEEPQYQSRSSRHDFWHTQQRQNSTEAVWNIRDSSPHIMISTANEQQRSANLDTSNGNQQLSKESSSKEDLFNYQDRVAFALNINQVAERIGQDANGRIIHGDYYQHRSQGPCPLPHSKFSMLLI
ncbi:hypothetical protein ACQRIT_005149 [Beauveria bassiana]